MNLPKELKYRETHEWVKTEEDLAYVGISDYAQDSLGDIVFVELPEPGDEFNAGDEVLTIESVKAASSIYAPVSGTIEKVNEDLEERPELINENSYEQYLFVIKMSDPSELENLLDADGYKEVVEKEKEEE